MKIFKIKNPLTVLFQLPVFLITLFFAINIVYSAYYYYKYPKYEIIVSLIVILTIVFSFRYIIVSGWLEKITEKKFIIIVLAIHLIFGLLSIFLIKNKLILDPLHYHNSAINFLHGNIKLDLVKLIPRRTIFYNLPFYYIFPNKYEYLKFYNLILTIATSLGFYYFLKINKLNLLISRVSILIFSIIPLRFFNLNIPSHDIAGIFFFVLFLVVFSLLAISINKKKWISASIYLVGTIIFLLVVEIQRSLGLFIAASLIVLILYNLFQVTKKRKYMFLIAVGLVIIGYLFSYSSIMKVTNSSVDNSSYTFGKMLFSFNKLGTFGRYIDGLEIRYSYLDKVEDSELIDHMALCLYLDQIVNHPFEKTKLYLKKGIGLLSFRAAYFIEPIDGKTIFLREKSDYFNHAFRIFLYSALILGLFKLMQQKQNLSPEIEFLIIFLFVFVAVLILISEISPNYSFLLFPTLSIISSMGLTSLFKGELFLKSDKIKNISSLGIISIILIFIFYFILSLAINKLPFKMINPYDSDLITKNISVNKNNIDNAYYSLDIDINNSDNSIIVQPQKPDYRFLSFFVKHKAKESLKIEINDTEVYNSEDYESNSSFNYSFIKYPLNNESKNSEDLKIVFSNPDSTKNSLKNIVLSYFYLEK